MTEVTPAIFTDNPQTLTDEVAALAPFVSWIQIDISDGTMVPARTVTEGNVLAEIVALYPNISFEAHLMVDNPVKYLKMLVDAGFKRVIAQVECSDPRGFLDEAALESVEIGLALDGASEVEIFEPFLEGLDTAVIMTIEAGTADSPFLPESLEKIKAVHHHVPDLSLAAEGSIDERNGKLLTEAGVTRLVISADILLKDPANLPQTLQSLQGK